MYINHVAIIGDEYGVVWFSERAITYIFLLKMGHESLHVSYNCKKNELFVIHHQESGKLDMVFCMHHSGLLFHFPCEDRLKACM